MYGATESNLWSTIQLFFRSIFSKGPEGCGAYVFGVSNHRLASVLAKEWYSQSQSDPWRLVLNCEYSSRTPLGYPEDGYSSQPKGFRIEDQEANKGLRIVQLTPRREIIGSLQAQPLALGLAKPTETRVAWSSIRYQTKPWGKGIPVESDTALPTSRPLARFNNNGS
ncbi:hypothetical protein BU24DRAFT_1496 [Aaosphaeria arxii CBS 175.79]|uniref:Uncharacterized protein n=1 Tax=Aaosphaeria arxii CBS 175.79 TaxID=1450172 RepID=A0A6A5Y4H1_9PLEO|nr:uncharacterized protein BU24DRAFT_1496 [Aaosphaeria arxii CBS 175.79]KAF2020452.1 hypothetical protein BU24DRAFT_1496 [Aaosphaeria arxii CBS 175.79]